MFTIANYADCYLIRPADLDLELDMQPTIVKENMDVLRQVVMWVEGFLCNPHQQLGRAGAVCPYTETSMKKDQFWLTIWRGDASSVEGISHGVIRYRDWFLEIEPRFGKEAQFKTILMLFPDLRPEDAPTIIDVVQQKLKPEFVSKGLMIGQFHPHCPEPGLWNQDFRPLQSPVPLLAMRHMVLSDFPFLRMKEKFLSSYIEVFSNAIPPRIQEKTNAARLQLRMQG